MRYFLFVNKMAWVGISLCLFSCGSNKEEIAAINFVNTGLEESNTVISEDIVHIKRNFEDLVDDPKTIAKAKDVYAKMLLISTYADDFFLAIDSLKQKLANSNNSKFEAVFSESDKQVIRLRNKKFMSELVSVDTIRLNDLFQETRRNDIEISDTFFKKGLNASGIKALLTAVQSKIRIIERNAIIRMRNSIAVEPIHYFEVPLVHINRSKVLPNEELTITVGMGQFRWPDNVEIRFDDKPFRLSDNLPYAEYSFIAPNVPGFYNVDVMVKEIRPDSNTQFFRKKVTYRVEK